MIQTGGIIMMNNQLQKIITLDDIAYKSGGYVEYLPIKNSENDNFTKVRQYCLKKQYKNEFFNRRTERRNHK